MKIIFAFLASCIVTSPALAQSASLALQGRALADGEQDFCFEINRPWREANPLPAHRPWLSEYVEDYDIVQKRLEGIVQGSEKNRALLPNVDNLYRSYMDIELRNKRGMQPLTRELRAIRTTQKHADIARLIAKFNRLHRDLTDGATLPAPTPFVIEVWPDATDSKRQLVHLVQSGLGLPGKTYYTDESARLVEIRRQYRDHIARTFKLAGEPNASDAAAGVLETEITLAQFQWDLSKQQDVHSSSRKFSVSELERFAPGFDWRRYFNEAALDLAAPVVIDQPSYVRSAAQFMGNLPIERMQAYLRWQLLRQYAMYLGEPFADAAFDFYGTTVLGFKTKPTLQQRAMDLVQNHLGAEISAAYAKEHFLRQSKVTTQAIAENVRRAYQRRIEESSWLAPSTRAEALRKLEKLRIEIGFPEHSAELPSVDMQPDDLIGNLMRLSERAYGIALNRLHKPTDRTEWWVSPVSVNGTYSVTRNTLIITAGRLQAPLFDPAASDAENYGGLGTLIGHEMGHALDNQGSEYDADGNLRDWWTPADRQEFKRRTERLAQQYSQYEALPGIYVDGVASLSENIADLAGLTVGYEAFKLARQSQSKPMTAADLHSFFAGWAHRWRVQYTEPLLIRILKSDTHPPLQYRCTVPLANFAPFYEAIGIEKTSSAYISTENRVSIW